MATIVRTAPLFPSLVNRFFDETDTLWQGYHQTVPSVNVLENDNGFNLQLAAPGFTKEDFKISVHENALTVSVEKEEETQKFNKREFNYNSFKRSFTLPKSVDADKIEAQYTQGILDLTIPKKEEAKPKEPKLIEVA